jgi:hypothetical protein
MLSHAERLLSAPSLPCPLPERPSNHFRCEYSCDLICSFDDGPEQGAGDCFAGYFAGGLMRMEKDGKLEGGKEIDGLVDVLRTATVASNHSS